jgi:hypothetical protein
MYCEGTETIGDKPSSGRSTTLFTFGILFGNSSPSKTAANWAERDRCEFSITTTIWVQNLQSETSIGQVQRLTLRDVASMLTEVLKFSLPLKYERSQLTATFVKWRVAKMECVVKM